MGPALLLLAAPLHLGDPGRHRLRGGRGRGIAAARPAASRRAAARPPACAHRDLPALLRLAPLGLARGRDPLEEPARGGAHAARAEHRGRFLAAGRRPGPLSSMPSGRWRRSPAGWRQHGPALTVVIGPQWVRNDLRSDLLKLDLLRSYPLRAGRWSARRPPPRPWCSPALQLGSPASRISPSWAIPTMDPSLQPRTVVAARGGRCLPGINYLGMLIQNGAALLSPPGCTSERPARGRRGARPEHADDRGLFRGAGRGLALPGLLGRSRLGCCGTAGLVGGVAGGACCWPASRSSPRCCCAGSGMCSSHRPAGSGEIAA